MLILKEPIKLKSLSPIVSPADGFFERMDANYKQIQAKYSTEELFHLLNQSPEIYVEEGGMTTLVTQNQNHLNQEVRLEMIHNLLNRLMMSDSSDFTYQDTVFVQNMLEKLGVRNVSEFMRQLYEMQESTKNTKQLLHIYKTNTETLGMIIESVKMQEGKEEKEVLKEESNTFPSYWIHNEIFKRLQTGNVYYTAAAFQKDQVHYQRSIDSREVEMAGQIHISESLNLQRLENSVLMREDSLLEHRVNIYEEGTGSDSYEKDKIINELAQAVLLNISENLYQTGLARQNDGRKAWYRFKGDFHQILEDTLNRFSTYHFQDIRYNKYKDGKGYQQSVNALRREKIGKLNKILKISVKTDSENKGFYSKENPENRKGEERSVREQSLETVQKKDERIQRVTESEELQILNEINVASKRLEYRTESREKRKEQEKRLEEEIRILNEENRRRMEETEVKEELHKKALPVQINKERTRKEMLLLLEHPELLDQYAEETEPTEAKTEEISKQLTLVQSSLKEIEKRKESESAERIQTQNLVKEEAKLRKEYVELLRQSVRPYPAKEEGSSATGRKKEDYAWMEHPELPDRYTEETELETEEISKRLILVQSSLKEIEKRKESESAEQIQTQNLVKEEAKLRKEYVELLRQSVRPYPAKEESSSATGRKKEDYAWMEHPELPDRYTEETESTEAKTEETSKRLTLVQSSLKEIEKRKESESAEQMKRTVLTYLDIVSKERLEEELHQSRKHIAEEQKTERIHNIHKELIHIRQEDVQDTVKQIKRQEQSHVFRQMQRQTDFTNQGIRLYHKETDTFTREMIEDIVSPATITNRTEEVNDQTHTQKIVTKQQIHKQTDNLVKKNSEHINEMINRGVQRQLNMISEQVYHKLEKKLSNDRKRRGY